MGDRTGTPDVVGLSFCHSFLSSLFASFLTFSCPGVHDTTISVLILHRNHAIHLIFAINALFSNHITVPTKIRCLRSLIRLRTVGYMACEPQFDQCASSTHVNTHYLSKYHICQLHNQMSTTIMIQFVSRLYRVSYVAVITR